MREFHHNTVTPDAPDPLHQRVPLIYALIFGLVSLGIITAGYYYYRHYEQHYLNKMEFQLLAFAELKEGELTQWRKERLGDGSILFQNPVVSSLVRQSFENPADSEPLRQLQGWLGKYVDTHQYDHVLLLDTQGVIRLSIPATRPMEVESIIPQRMTEVMERGQVEFQDFYRNEHDQRVYLSVLVPILDVAKARRPLGLLVFRINPETFLYPFIKLWPLGSQTGETLLVRREGNEAVVLNQLRVDPNAALNHRTSLDQIRRTTVQAALGRQGLFVGVNIHNDPVVAALRAIPDSPWSLVARMERAEIYAPIRDRLWQLVALTCVFLFGMGALAWLILRRQHVRFYRERAASVDSIRETKEYLENLITHANAPIIVWDPQFHITRFNHAFESLTGRKAADVVGGPLEILFPVAQVANSMELIRNTLGGERWEAVEISIQHCDGSVRTVLWNSATIYAADGKTPLAAIAQGQDITKRKRAEESLRESESKYHSLIDNMTEGVALHEIIYDQNGKAVNYRIVDVNPAFAKQTGIAVNEAIGRLATDLYHVAAAPFLEIYDRVVRTGTPCTFETENPVLNKKFTVSVYSPKPGWFATLFADITQRLKLNEANARLATAVEQAAETVVITDANGAILYANPAFEKTTGYTRAEALGQNPRIWKSGKHAAEFYHHMWEV